MKRYTIIAGVNGVGKSSLTGVLKAERNDLGFVIDVDRIAAESKSGNLEAGKSAIFLIDRFINEGVSFSQETTLSGTRTIKNIKIAKKNNYTVRLFYIGLGRYEESVKRIKNRVEKGGHHVDSIDVIRRYNKRKADLMKILPLCDEVRFYDNENGFVEVGEYKNGGIITKGEYKPAWLAEFM